MLSEENLAIHNDTGAILKYFDEGRIKTMHGNSGGNYSVSKALLRNAQYTKYYSLTCENAHDGEICHIYKLTDGDLEGKYVVILDSFGSCDYCDSYDSRTGEDLIAVMRDLIVQRAIICSNVGAILEIIDKGWVTDKDKIKDDIRLDIEG